MKLVAIVGRPNVGKSTLFNRLAGRRIALVEDVPGVTRDRHYADVIWEGRAFGLVDTGGFVPSDADPLLASVRGQAMVAVQESEAVLFLVDGRSGLTGPDRDVAAVLRRSQRPVLLVVNKVDRPEMTEGLLADFHSLGFPDIFAVSAEHGLGTTDLLDRLITLLPTEEPAEASEDDTRIRIAIIGRPNVGKSTLLNAFLGSERMVASEQPGTTRDAVDSEMQFGGRDYVLTDTAGIRRKGQITERLEQVSVFSALRALERSDIAALIIDATEPAVDQDARLAGLVEEKSKALLVVVNKWDLAQKAGKREEEFRAYIKDRLRFIGYAPIVFTSALKGNRVERVLEVAAQLWDQFHFRATTPRLNKLMERVVDSHPAPVARGRPLRLYFIRQVRTAPPTFAVTCNRPASIPESYRRYLVNQLREAFDLKVPLHLVLKDRPGQAKRQARKRPK